MFIVNFLILRVLKTMYFVFVEKNNFVYNIHFKWCICYIHMLSKILKSDTSVMFVYWVIHVTHIIFLYTNIYLDFYVKRFTNKKTYIEYELNVWKTFIIPLQKKLILYFSNDFYFYYPEKIPSKLMIKIIIFIFYFCCGKI